ncbi:type II TA system antitoxin MqsA family protein [Anaeromyxobacter oryzae]|uniref:HTH cro/C1-type domain-containing protein n=1 Tax=Anaeromyxobacter oryzae TaxID=2918170 RepID=A0ABM7X3D1_9BACT|nr:type II TA system antitoxin MqsA family protein [Anaeromyxobacter oryzae]BDG06305.1 hypothetical protein AMOR_53010 [Anaeromyxobacter oryzae]
MDPSDTARCPRCGTGDLDHTTETLNFQLPGSAVIASAAVPARRCGRCDGVHVDEATAARFRLAACCALADAGVRGGEALRAMRKALRLRASDLARLLDVTPETMSHWETGKVPPNRAAFVAVCAMVQDAVDGRTTTRDRLAVLADGRVPPGVVRVDLG